LPCLPIEATFYFIVSYGLRHAAEAQNSILFDGETSYNECDNTLNDEHREAADINLTDQGFKKKVGTPASFKICKKGQWNERMGIETLFSLWTRICNMKKSFHRTTEGFKAKIAYLAALTNIILRKNEELGYAKLSMVQWSL
jgi:hypothetical protein